MISGTATVPAAALPDAAPPRPPATPRVRVLASRWAPVIAALIAAASQWLIWRSLDGVPSISDEASYLLQARLFADFRWTAPAAPIREFFEQAHVLASPVIASKYPPGHALLLALGVMLGAPGLMPIVLTGLTAGFLFAIVRRLANGEVAALACLIWTFAPVPIGFRPSYFSQTTTAATWVVGWWALLRWRDDARMRWLVLLSVMTAWCAITRPVTAVAYAVPTAAFTLVLLWRRRDWRAASIGLLAGIAVVAILPLWSWRTLGAPGRTPYLAYNETYIPFEHLGFGDNGGRTPLWLPPDIYAQMKAYEEVHTRYVPATFAADAASRAYTAWYHFLGRATWTAVLSVFIVVGVFCAGSAGVLGALSVVALWLSYLLYAHAASWTIYYYEALAPLAFFSALGVARAAGFVLARRVRGADALALPVVRRATLAVALVCVPFALATAGASRGGKRLMTASQTAFARALKRMPTPAIVFIRYAPNHVVHASLMDNEPDLAHAAIWRVYDRGPEENARLRALAPERHAFLYDQARRTFFALK